MDDIFRKKLIKVAVVGRNLEDLLPMLKMFPCEIVEESPDLVISHGGDGALLGAERRYPDIPKCPLRDHRENPKCPRHSEISTLQKLFSGQLKPVMLSRLVAEKAGSESIRGINEILMDRTCKASAIRYRIWVDGELFRPQVVADSLIISTPFGSTGYFQSIARGNFTKGLGLAFNNAMDLMGFAVIGEDSKVTVELLRGPAVMGADNDSRMIPLESGDSFTVHAEHNTTPLYGLEIFRCMDCYDLRKNGVKNR